VRGFDPGEYRSILGAEVPIGEAFALLESGLPGSRLRVVASALCYATFEIVLAGELRAETRI
jgi:hypothetical protein